MSTLRVNTLQDVAGTGQPAMSGAAKAWVNFNGSGTVAIRASFNVSSITDNGTGDYTVNLTNAMSDANFAVVSLGGFSTTVPGTVASAGAPVNSSSARIGFFSTTATAFDRDFVSVAFFR